MMNLREARFEDAEAIARVHVASWKTTYPGIVPQPHLDGLSVENGIARWRERLAEGGPLTLVAEDEAGVFGFASGGAMLHPVAGFDGEVAAIYLLASHQGRGAGAQLMREMARRLRDQGFLSMVVWALRDNPACGFYARIGGVRVAEQMIEIGGVALPEVAFGWQRIEAIADATEFSAR